MANDKLKLNDLRDAGSPMTSGQPEQFSSESPEHLAALGDGAPPMPNAIPGRRFFKMHDIGGGVIQSGVVKNERGEIVRPARSLRIAGQVFAVDAAEADEIAVRHPELTEVDATGKPLPKTRDKLATRQTGEASGFQKR